MVKVRDEDGIKEYSEDEYFDKFILPKLIFQSKTKTL